MTNEEIRYLIHHSLHADLGFIDESGMPAIRRVYCTWHKGIGAHLISTNTSSMHVQALLKKTDACLYFANSDTYEGVCFTGKAIVHFEPKYKEMLWHDGDERYYPKGVADEDYCIIEFISDHARYYRADGIGNISMEELTEFDKNTEFEDYSDLLP